MSTMNYDTIYLLAEQLQGMTGLLWTRPTTEFNPGWDQNLPPKLPVFLFFVLRAIDINLIEISPDWKVTYKVPKSATPPPTQPGGLTLATLFYRIKLVSVHADLFEISARREWISDRDT